MENDKEPSISPWGSVDVKNYDHVFKEFGLQHLPESAKKLDHLFFKRGIAIAHRDFDKILNCVANKKPFINITGIASSGRLHLGHKTAIMDSFLFFHRMGGKSYFIIADIDGYVSRPDEKVASMEQAKQFAIDNLAHALALGIPKKNICIQSKQQPIYYQLAFEISKKLTENMFKAAYGHLDVGKVAANLLQYADILHPQLEEYEGPMPSITAIGLDQDPHARLARDIARRLPYKMELPSFLHLKFLPGLQQGGKMSSSNPLSSIYLDDDPETVKTKIMKHAFSGGKETLEEHRKLGGDPDIDVAFQILRYTEPSDKVVNRAYEEYRSGKMLTGELKKFVLERLLKFLKDHQTKYSKNKKVAEKMVLG